MGAAALPPFGEKNLSPSPPSGSGIGHDCDSQGGNRGCQRIFTPPRHPERSRGIPLRKL